MKKDASYEQSERNRCDAIEYMREYNENFSLRENRQPTAFTHSYGCQQNTADNEIINGLLLEMGYTFCEEPELADVVIYNTCAIRENAEDRVFGNIGELKLAKERNPDMIIGIFGCMVQQKHVLERLEKSYPFVDLMFGSGVMYQLPEILVQKVKENGKIISVSTPTTDIVENLPIKRDDKARASIPIISGCNNFCSYCVVPYVRGRERSRESSVIIDEANQLIKDGYKEITLLGQNVNSYGKDKENEVSFSHLLEEIANIPGKFRLRFMTSHPKDCTKELIDTIARHEKISKHIHLPVQSGSDRILKEMNRGYTSKHYLELVDYAKGIMPDISFTSDIIVGFPDESEDDFLKTMELADYVGYSSLFTFIYSKRPGTKAAEMNDGTLDKEKIDRLSRLIELQRKKANEFNEKLVGSTVEVLVEGKAKKPEGYLTGRTDGNIIVIFPSSDESLIGKFADIKINKFMNWAVEGQLLI